MTAQVTQYMRPNGRRVAQETDLDDSVVDHYQRMKSRGWNLSAEVLQTGLVSIAIEDRTEGVDVDLIVVPNGPEIAAAYERMLRRHCS